MKNATFFVSLRTSSTRGLPAGCGDPTSNHSVSASFVVPAPTNWRAAPPRWSPEPDGCTSWFAKVTFSVSGLNCTVHQVVVLISFSNVASSWRSSAFARLATSGTGASARALELERLVGDLQLLDGDHPVLAR